MGQVELVIDKPYPKQIEFFESQARYTGYGGARGGGKSWSARTKAVLLALANPRCSNFISKKNFNRIKRKPRYSTS